MAIFSIDKINYVVTGSSEQLINVRIKNSGSEEECNRNFTFVTDCGPDREVQYLEDMPIMSAIYRTHRLWKLGRATTYAMGDEKGYNNKDWVDAFNKELSEDQADGERLTTKAQIVDTKSDVFTQVYALFDAKDVIYKSGYRKMIARLNRDSENANIDDAEGYVDVYSPRLSDDFMGFVQHHKCDSLGMTETYTYEPYIQYTTLRDDRQDRLSNDSGKMIWNYVLKMRDAETFSYTPLSDLRKSSINTGEEDYDPYSAKFSATSYYDWLTSFKELSVNRLSTLFEPRYNLSGIPRNYISRFSMTLDMYNDFNSGIVAGDFMYAKNPYNAEYSMHMPQGPTDSSVEPWRANLSGVRKYIGIGAMGGKPFLKYYDDNTYIPVKKDRPDSSDPRERPDFPYSTIDADRITAEKKDEGIDLTIQNVEMKKDEGDSRRYPEQERKYQNVEFFESMNRGLNNAVHKSNLYSVKISNLKWNGNTGKELEKIKQDIRNTVRKICDHLQPAHTQLFKVYIDNSNNYSSYRRQSLEEEELKLEFDDERNAINDK